MADINELIGGYKLRTLLQTGQKSQVFEVVETRSNRHFAMKVLLPESASNPEARRELFNDAEVGIKMAHQNVVRIFKVDRSKERPFFVMEFFPSGSLRLRLQAKDLKFIRDHSRKIFREAATGLAYMNAMGYVHRDVKPDNILVNSIGDTKIIDFAITQKIPTGFEKIMGRLRRSFRGRGPQGGTPSYMSPEQIKGDDLDGRSDVYAFACTLYELTTGRKPFTGMTQQDLLIKHFTEKPAPLFSYNKDLTEEFSNLVVRMLAKRREDRPANFHEVLMALQKIRIFKDERLEDPEAPGPPAVLAPTTRAPDVKPAAGANKAAKPPAAKPQEESRPKPSTSASGEAPPINPDDIDIDAL
jgi:serine/threonine-protein kinase